MLPCCAEGLAAKEQALAAAQKELGRTKKQVVVLKEAADRRHSLEAELAASRCSEFELCFV